MGLGGSTTSRRPRMGQLPKIRTVRNRALAFKILVMEIAVSVLVAVTPRILEMVLVVLSRGMRTV